MPNFKLVFELFFDSLGESKVTGEFSRIVTAYDLYQAIRLAEAMLGEEIWAHEYLHLVILVRETAEGAKAEYWDDGTRSWRRTLRQAGIPESAVEFVTDAKGHKVGIRLRTAPPTEQEGGKRLT